jgi:multiple PDZ domain protein
VDSVDKGVNGMLVVAVAAGGCIAHDGRISPGDYLLSVNNESLRKVTNSQARAILRRTQLLSTDIRYIVTHLGACKTCFSAY